MKHKQLIQRLGFTPKVNTSGIFQKKYSKSNGYAVEIDFEKEVINFGDKIKGESKTTQNFSQAENWVVLECVDRLLEKGYQPQNIALEKTWKTGHGTSGRLDVLVSRDDNSAYLMIECKTWGTEFDKELKNLEKNGGQLFTYFQQDKNAEILMLYASDLDSSGTKYRNEIIKIEEDYRQAGNVKDFYERWNKLPKSNGVFENWVSVYEFQSKALTKNDLKVLRQEDSSFIFNRFLEILRHNVVSDKPNAFNKIFTLFLCKIVDENRNEDEQLHFQWLEGEDNHVSFQKRLTDLYNRGMLELLEKKVTDVSDSEFDKQFLQVEDQYKDKFKEILTEIRLKKNNEFAIKEVYDDASFEENAKVVKEVVELLQVYQIRYNYRQQFLSDFFELLLTTGLKQESGQFFTPVPIARFIIKSLPFQEITEQKIEQGNKNDLLPAIIDYAAGSGHFITESMEVVQKFIDNLDENKYNPTTKKSIKKWKEDQFDWAETYVYGIEKDYRLVKTAKVSCYLHGDGLAKVIHGDGLGDFATSTEFKDLLKETDKTYPQDNKQFDVIISNPPYSVSAFKGSMVTEEKAKRAFDLYPRLTDQSSEIECLFIERTKQLLKDGGVAGIILPSSILSNTGIYTQTREILLKYFDILGITELGSGTFMATGTNTVTLFLRRRNNADSFNIEEAIKKFFVNFQDVTINGIEKPIQKYISHVWNNISLEDYVTLLQKQPNAVIEKHEIYQEYRSKIKAKNEYDKWNSILALEQDKLLYFVIAYPQKIVLVKTGEKNEEKRFLGYEFSNRRGSEGIHAIQREKTIDDCTHLYDPDLFDNPNKASTYIYKAFKGEFDLDLPKDLQKNISYHNLVDMFTFDRVDFEKNISLSIKKKVKFEEIWKTAKLEFLDEIAVIKKGKTITASKAIKGDIPVIAGGQSPAYYHNDSNRSGNVITVSASGAYAGFLNYFDTPIFASDCNTIESKDENIITTKLIFDFLKSMQQEVYKLQRGQAQPHVYGDDLAKIKIPVPSKDIQKKIVSEIEILEKKESQIKNEIAVLKQEIINRANLLYENNKLQKLGHFCEVPVYGANEKAISGNPLIDYRYIRITDINDNGSLNNDWKTAEKVEEKYILEEGDFLFARSGATAGKTFLYKKEYGKALYAGYLIKFNAKKEKLNSDFLNFILKGDNYNNWVLDMRRGAAQPNINAQQYSSFEIPKISLSEQEKIVLDIEKTEKKLTDLENEIDLIPKKKELILRKYLN
ncbi:restriction endonuclease subunit S [Flavobacterium sp.]|uniref:restriction endonuclease subunit S n=1 Tax=Flavobacterium sp. TaxID=239 RepID=UPI002635AFD1|nr:restriction endonuclease subunit S [Flavobacterium sp.]